MKTPWIVFGLLSASLAVASSSGCAKPDAESASVRHVAELGGRVTVDPRRPERGVEAVILRERPLTADNLSLLAGIESLERLDLYGTPIGDEALVHINRHVSLRWLNLAGTRVTDDGLRQLAPLTELGTLALGTATTDDGLTHLAPFAKLHTLYAGDTQVTGRGLRELASLPSLRTLWLERSRITDDDLAVLAELPALERLSLAETAVTDAGLVHLQPLRRLDYLSLADTAVSDDGIDALCALRSLYILDVPNTKITQDGIRRLEQALPDATICHERPAGESPAGSTVHDEQ